MAVNVAALRVQLLLTSVVLILGSCSPSGDSVSTAPGVETLVRAHEGPPGSQVRLGRRRGSLLYAVGSLALYVFTYPAGKLIAKVSGHGGAGACSDQSGNVFVTQENQIEEYAHGGTAPIETLGEPGFLASSCSVDPYSGDLAVMNDSGTSGNVAIYPGAHGPPRLYSDPNIRYYYYCGYDSEGNLFIDGGTNTDAFAFAELPFGNQSFIDISGISKLSIGSVQWDGQYVTISNQSGGGSRGKIYRLRVSGSTASVAGTTRLAKWHPHILAQSWIQGRTFTAPSGVYSREIAIWEYPFGGKSIRSFGGPFAKDRLHAVAVSLAPKRAFLNSVP